MPTLTDDELRATVRAGRRWAAERDLPDPVGWADLAFAPDAMAAVIRGRTDGEYAPARAHSMPLPKSVGGEPRGMTVCHDCVVPTLACARSCMRQRRSGAMAAGCDGRRARTDRSQPNAGRPSTRCARGVAHGG